MYGVVLAGQKSPVDLQLVLMYIIPIGYFLQIVLVFFSAAACIDIFPGTPARELGAAINGKLTEIRLKHRKVAVGGDAGAEGKLDLSTKSLDNV